MLRQRTHHVFQALAHQDDLIARIQTRLKLFYSIDFQVWLQFVLEVFFTQQDPAGRG